MKVRIKQIGSVFVLVAATALAAATIFPMFSHARSNIHRRGTPLQIAWMHRLDPIIASGYAALDKGDYATAEGRFKAAISEDPSDRGLWFNLVKLYDVQGRDPEAMGAYGRLLLPNDQSLTDQLDPRMWARYGDLLSKFGNNENAISAYLSAAHAGDRTPPEGASLATLRGIAHTAAGERYSLEGNQKDAAKEMAKAVSATPNSWEAQYYSGIAKAELGDKAGAEAALAYAEAHAPADKLKQLRHRRATLRVGENATISQITISGGKATLSVKPAN